MSSLNTSASAAMPKALYLPSIFLLVASCSQHVDTARIDYWRHIR